MAWRDCDRTMSDEFQQEENQERRSRIWIWLLIIILLALLLVPVVSIAFAVKKTEWIPLKKSASSQSSLTGNGRLGLTHPPGREGSDGAPQIISLRDKVEKLAASLIALPQLRPKMEMVVISSPSTTTPFSVKEILAARHHQFVEAVDKDRVRLVVILPSKEWVELSGALEVAANKDGFIYSGPKETSATPETTDSMVAEIEIVRNPNAPAKHPPSRPVVSDSAR